MYSLILHGKKCIDSHKLCSLRVVSVKLVQNGSAFSNSFSSAATASVAADVSLEDGSKGKIFTVESTSSEESPVLNVLRSYGFTASQISGIVSTYPRLLSLDAERSVLPKLQALQSRGASSSELREIVSIVPKILGERGAKPTGLYYDFIKDIIGKDKEKGGKSSKCDKLYVSSSAGRHGNRIRNILALRELGVPQRLLFRLLLSTSKVVSGKKKFGESVKNVVEMGFDPTGLKFCEALHVFYEMSETTIEEKVNVFKTLGFAEDEVWEMFKKWPYVLKFSEQKIIQTVETLKKCGLVEDEVISVMKKRPAFIRASEEKIMKGVETFLGIGFSREEFLVIFKCLPSCTQLSPETVKKKTEFIVKKMDWSLRDVVAFPPVLGYSLEKRLKPRCKVIKALMAKGLIKGRKGVPPKSSALSCKDQTFLKRYVLKHGELVPELMALFTEGRNGVSLTKRLTP